MVTIWDPITRSEVELYENPQARRRRREREQAQIEAALYENSPAGRLEARRKANRERQARWRAKKRAL